MIVFIKTNHVKLQELKEAIVHRLNTDADLLESVATRLLKRLQLGANRNG